MTTNFLIGFPELPFLYGNGLALRSGACSNQSDLILGARSKTAELTTAQVEPMISQYSLASSRTANFLAILRADLLKAQNVGAVSFYSTAQDPNTPATISNLQLWLDSTYGLTLDSERRISSWTDRSSNAYHMLQATAANKPVYSRGDNRENILSYSEDFSQANWTKHHTTATAAATTNPVNFETTAYKIAENTDTSEHALYQVQYMASGQAFRASAMVKAAGRSIAALFIDGGGVGTHGIVANLSTGSITSTVGSAVNATATRLTVDDWYLISFEVTLATAGSPNFYLQMRNGAGSSNYTGDGSSGLYVYGCQLSRAAADSTYTKTDLMCKRRGINGKNAVFSDEDYTHYLAPSVFTNLAITGDISIFALIRHDQIAANTSRIVHSSSGANGYTLSLAGLKLRYESNGVTLTGSTDLTAGVPYVVGVVKSGGTATLYVNNVADGSAIIGTPGAATLFTVSAASSPMRGDIGEIVIYSKAVNSTERGQIYSYLYDQRINYIGRTLALQTATLQGPKAEDLLITFATSSSSNHYEVSLSANGDAVKYTHSKQIFGQAFDFGRDPLWERLATAEIENAAERRAALRFRLSWQGITNAKRMEFESSLNRYSAEMGVILYTTDYSAPILGQSMIHVRILNYNATPRPARLSDIEVLFEEVIA